jgi:hypothetical protein
MNPKDIAITVDDPLMDGSPDPLPKPTTDDYDRFQGDMMLYSQLMSQMSIDPSVGTSGTKYEPLHASSYRTPRLSIQVPETQPDEVERHDRPHRQIRHRDTYSPSLIKIIFGRRY